KVKPPPCDFKTNCRILVVVVLVIKRKRSPSPIIFSINFNRKPPPGTDSSKDNFTGGVDFFSIRITKFHDQNRTIEDGINHLLGNLNGEQRGDNARCIGGKRHLLVKMVDIKPCHSKYPFLMIVF